MTDPEIDKIYGNKVRIRACGLLINEGKMLMVNHSGIKNGNFWAPPGGGVDFGFSIEETLKKEFLEETGLTINVGSFAFGVEFIQPPLHAVELFYNVSVKSGSIGVGHDPEYNIIQAVALLSNDEIFRIVKDERHGIFSLVSNITDLSQLQGFYKI
ncbi:NUDIX domain-containing protein [Pseudochryseolinea flava]|uniref:NUDIX hydrolase n=1 Tax=Pseudochryseolinea flava TaxID=2059302 RepID=A0A364XX45_9BACT|nr:NUDIX hydrolase [Pseudochryseolinea flava]RAV98773.1 NUDIX hydrolase [Pseudochryseolinea flava]